MANCSLGHRLHIPATWRTIANSKSNISLRVDAAAMVDAATYRFVSKGPYAVALKFWIDLTVTLSAGTVITQASSRAYIVDLPDAMPLYPEYKNFNFAPFSLSAVVPFKPMTSNPSKDPEIEAILTVTGFVTIRNISGSSNSTWTALSFIDADSQKGTTQYKSGKIVVPGFKFSLSQG